MPIRFKEKLHKTTIRPVVTYGAECWPIRKQHMQKVSLKEMRMLGWMCGKTRKATIGNECIQKHSRVASIDYKIRETCLRWFNTSQKGRQ